MCCVVAVLTLVIVVSFVVCLFVVGCLSSGRAGRCRVHLHRHWNVLRRALYLLREHGLCKSCRAGVAASDVAVSLRLGVAARCCVTDVLCCRGADARDCSVVCFFVCVLAGAGVVVWGIRWGLRHLGSE